MGTNAIDGSARKAGALYLGFAIMGVIGEFLLPKFVVPGDAAATALRISAGEAAFRFSLVFGLATLIVFIFLARCLYHLFKAVDHRQALLMLLLVSTGIAVAIANLTLKGAPLILLSGSDYFAALARPQLDAIVMTFIRLHAFGSQITTMFWGLWLFPFGLLVARSRFFPRILGYMLVVAGVGYVVTSLASLLFPDQRQLVTRLMMPLYFGELPIVFWMLLKGARGAA